MESLNHIGNSTITQLARQRKHRRDQQVPSQESLYQVEAYHSERKSSQHFLSSPSWGESNNEKMYMNEEKSQQHYFSDRDRLEDDEKVSLEDKAYFHGEVPPLLPAVPSAPQTPCKKCRGVGYLRANVPYGHPLFGKPIACECKRASKKEALQQQLLEQSQIDRLAAFKEETFETFQFVLPGVIAAYKAAMEFAERPEGWFVLAGDGGCGKTHLAVAIAKQCLKNDRMVLFAIVPDLLDYLRSTFAPTAPVTYEVEFKKMREVEVLILDDLGVEQTTTWAKEKLYQLLNYRYNARLATVFTTNKVNFEGLDQRLRSRLSDIRLVRKEVLTNAQDVRPIER